MLKVEQTFKKWLHIEDTRFLKVTLATVAANRADCDPLWLFLVAPPSGIKSETLRAFSGLDYIYPLSSITSRTFASGFGKKEANESLLLKLKSKTILTYKDFTTVLTGRKDERKEIFSQLREIYDGNFVKVFGNGVKVVWNGKLGFLAGVTPVIDVQHTVNQVLGERFLLFRVPQGNRKLISKKAKKNTGKEKAMREELQNAVTDFFNNIDIPAVVDINTDRFENEIIELADFTSRARTVCIRDSYSRDVLQKPEPESPARLTKQFNTLLFGLSVIEKASEPSEDSYSLVCKVALDTIPISRVHILRALHGNDSQDIENILESTRYPKTTVRRILEEFIMLEVVQKNKKKDTYRLHPDVHPIIDNILTSADFSGINKKVKP